MWAHSSGFPHATTVLPDDRVDYPRKQDVERRRYWKRVLDDVVKRAVIDAVNEELKRAPKKGHEERMERMPSEVREPENGEE